MPIYIGTLDYFIIQYGNAHGEKQNSWPNWWHLRNILINLTLGLTEKISYVMSVLTAEKIRLGLKFSCIIGSIWSILDVKSKNKCAFWFLKYIFVEFYNLLIQLVIAIKILSFKIYIYF